MQGCVMQRFSLERKKTVSTYLFDVASTTMFFFTFFYIFNFIGWQKMPSIHFMLTSTFFGLILPLSHLSLGLYECKVRENIRTVFRRTVLSSGLTFFAFELVNSFAQLETHNLTLLFGLIFAIVMQTVWRHFVIHEGYLFSVKRTVVFLGAGERAEFITKRMRRAVDRKHFSKWSFLPLNEVTSALSERENIVSLMEGETTWDALRRINPDVIVLSNEKDEALDVDTLLRMRIEGAELVELEDFVESELGQIPVEKMKSEWLLVTSGFNLNRKFYEHLNTGINIILAVFVLALTWPLMIMAMLAIYFEDGRKDKASVFYKQVRVGLNDKPFEIIKFRSMGKNAEANGAQWASKDDMRVTRVGHYLRKYRIDELPQLFNVLKGEMCFVGPRPERPEFVEKLAEQIPFFHYRHCVKPGLTGWAQINYPYGDSINCSFEKLKFDLYYVKHRSFLLDMYSLLRTVEIVLFGKGR
tara:strand:- start:3003 stop:4412 length:1410 start_codon:yes stop_codon:yes gene_type:complete